MSSSSQTAISDIECFICEKSLKFEGAGTVKKKRIETLIKSSIKRGRKDHNKILKNRVQIQVHSACSKNYCDERRINSSLRQRLGKAGTYTSSQQVRVGAKIFNFKSHCFLCGEVIKQDYALSQRNFLWV